MAKAKKKVEEPTKRGRGRPKGSKNKPKASAAVGSRIYENIVKARKAKAAKTKTAKATGEKRGRGRPKGSTNKPKLHKGAALSRVAKIAEGSKKRGRPTKEASAAKTRLTKRKASLASKAHSFEKAGKVMRRGKEIVPVGVKHRGRPPKKSEPVKVGRGRPTKEAAAKRAKVAKRKASLASKAHSFGVAGKVKNHNGRVVPVGVPLRGRKVGTKDAAKRTRRKKSEMAALRSPAPGTLSHFTVMPKKGRGRPKGAKDKVKRKSRLRMGGTATPVFHPNLDHVPHIKMVVNHTPTKRAGTVKTNKMGQLRTSR